MNKKIPLKESNDVVKSVMQAIRTAIGSYKRFALMEDSHKTDEECAVKKFKNHHDACKVAIAHIKLLIELMKSVDVPDKELENAKDELMLAQAIAAAHKELDKNAAD